MVTFPQLLVMLRNTPHTFPSLSIQVGKPLIHWKNRPLYTPLQGVSFTKRNKGANYLFPLLAPRWVLVSAGAWHLLFGTRTREKANTQNYLTQWNLTQWLWAQGWELNWGQIPSFLLFFYFQLASFRNIFWGIRQHGIWKEIRTQPLRDKPS